MVDGDLWGKSRLLMEEARRDLDAGCPNKAVSASYFAVRMAAESLLRGLRTRKDDKVANALKRLLEPTLGEERAGEIRNSFLRLFSLRKAADHTPRVFSLEEAREIVREAEAVLVTLEAVRRGPRRIGPGE